MRNFDVFYYLQTHYNRKTSTLKTLRNIQTSQRDCQPSGHFITQPTPQLQLLSAYYSFFEEKCSEEVEPSALNEGHSWENKKGKILIGY